MHSPRCIHNENAFSRMYDSHKMVKSFSRITVLIYALNTTTPIMTTDDNGNDHHANAQFQGIRLRLLHAGRRRGREEAGVGLGGEETNWLFEVCSSLLEKMIKSVQEARPGLLIDICKKIYICSRIT